MRASKSNRAWLVSLHPKGASGFLFHLSQNPSGSNSFDLWLLKQPPMPPTPFTLQKLEGGGGIERAWPRTCSSITGIVYFFIFRFKGWQHYLHTWKDRIKQSPWCVEPLLPLLRPETTLLSCPCVSWYSAVCCTAHTCGHNSVLGDSVFCDPNVSGQRHFGHEEQSVRSVETFPSHTPFLPTPSFPVYPREADWVLFLLLRYVW